MPIKRIQKYLYNDETNTRVEIRQCKAKLSTKTSRDTIYCKDLRFFSQ